MVYNIEHLKRSADKIPQMIDELCKIKKKENIKILVRPWNGLADSLGSLNVVLYYAVHVCGLNPNQIFFANRGGYRNLNEFLDFNQINYFRYRKRKKEELKSQFDIVVNKGFFVGLYWTHPNHFKNYISFNSKLIEESMHYKCCYAIHIRNKKIEKKSCDFDLLENKSRRCFIEHMKIIAPSYDLEGTIETTINQIKSLVNSNKSTYFISTDSMLYSPADFNEVQNIKIIEKHNNVAQKKYRKNARSALLDLAIMSLCKTIYTTVPSGFNILAVLLSNNKDLAFCNNVSTNQDDLVSIFTQKEYIKKLF